MRDTASLVHEGGTRQTVQGDAVNKLAIDKDVACPPFKEDHEMLCRLVQDDDLISRIHIDELPPGEYDGALLVLTFPPHPKKWLPENICF